MFSYCFNFVYFVLDYVQLEMAFWKFHIYTDSTREIDGKCGIYLN